MRCDKRKGKTRQFKMSCKQGKTKKHKEMRQDMKGQGGGRLQDETREDEIREDEMRSETGQNQTGQTKVGDPVRALLSRRV